ncbi:DUF2750 domain-containing protein [Pseudoalteromonas sp. NZS127]|uniref:DUF2750 domain-containing protein n=1 Tax=unclassified Pseudoalteromonas TaxID=194690 RepID=UPI0018CFDC29|nr:DUF2750 domain-containing protein [Pseudoalteromonas sp. NZS127]MBH0072523.1 DUF2750 domain-containing protein [Pseudoalteromonas sp. NZS127]|tara:strand:+ start:7665 stop:8054 length:390 start_codon:yes stop_codon:yes gene_type:complete
MTTANNTEQHDVILGLGAKKRLAFMFETTQQFKQVWILNDDDGCVMLTNEDDDCVPVWPTREFAQAWATGEWEGCTSKAIPTQDWINRWTPGLEDDDLLIAVFPTEDDDGTILFPDEFDTQLKMPKKKY